MPDTDSTIITCSVLTAAVMVTSEFAPQSMGGKGEFPPVKLLLGLGVTTMGLALLGEIAPEVGKWLAICVATSAVLYSGAPMAEQYFAGDKKGKTK